MDNNDTSVQSVIPKDSKIFKIIIIVQFFVILALTGFVIKISTEVSEIRANVKYVAEEFAFQSALASDEDYGCGYDDPAIAIDKYTTDSSSSSTENENKSSDNSGQ